MQTERSEKSGSGAIAAGTESLTAPLSNLDSSAPQPPSQPPSTAYRDAINLASGAVTLGQQATSLDDWALIVGRWEQSIEKLQDVPEDDQHYATAQTKLQDYGRHLAQAQQRLETLKQPPPEINLASPAVAAPAAPRAPITPTARTARTVPIIGRHGGTPVITVTLNGKQYPMILDTGASHTHITRTMANELGVQVVGQASVATASSNATTVDVAYVQSIRVGDISRTNLPVSIGDAVPIGLLGNDVYQNHDVILQVNSVEFRAR
ncbi:clan AA aspartic protease [Leptolyngbya cf. ectocarpi LEGE 11479]|uniref:Clan AA aspartic protease n=1 Tax=Leptolyngbya cf. ectocarpi LEGE 11479 TaxID=1828722 RepID=A0A928ZRZ9_LEPEC|nr:retropepsin-like aspartic protease [Leptolyngbya ectocarpi]MBE9065352.1 clan AA aspartic protease [Leptolyngbya cf. ectocarpi LEGE 11479]